MSTTIMGRSFVLAATLALSACATVRNEAQAPASDASTAVRALADEFVALTLDHDPSPAYYTRLEAPSHDYLPHNSAQALASLQGRLDDLSTRLMAIDATTIADRDTQIIHAQLRELLEAERDGRICRAEGWAISHMGGWQLGLVELAERQPVATDDERAQAIARWSSLPGFVDNEIANLRTGLNAGYSAPRSVVDRVITQIDAMLAAEPSQSPFFAPGRNSDDPGFKMRFETLVADRIQPALTRYRGFLAESYRPRARESLAITALPNGEACYRALLRDWTTLDREPREVYELGRRTVAANEEHVRDLGERLFGTGDIAEIIRRVDTAPDNRFESADEVLDFSRSLLERARERSVPMFDTLPVQPASVEPFPEHQRGSGVSSHYEPHPDDSQPGIYRINLDDVESERRGQAEITLVHETWPGHHLQIALARGQGDRHPIAELAFNSAYVEGWARYTEALAEEAGIYTTDYALVTRRIWPARGMVVDPGLHLYGWTREQAAEYIMSTGRFSPETADAMTDRIAVMPGQLTAYDSGGLEIMALRAEAERALGPRFDLREFHARILGDGIVPLPLLRQRITEWIEEVR